MNYSNDARQIRRIPDIDLRSDELIAWALPADARRAAHLEVAAAQQQIDLGASARLGLGNRSIDIVQLAVAAALHRNLIAN